MRLTWPIVAALVLLSVPPAQAESPGPSQESARSEAKDDPLIGTWASKTLFGPALYGELTVTREGSRWQATLSGAESRFTSTGDTVRFAFPRNLGGEQPGQPLRKRLRRSRGGTGLTAPRRRIGFHPDRLEAALPRLVEPTVLPFAAKVIRHRRGGRHHVNDKDRLSSRSSTRPRLPPGRAPCALRRTGAQ
jgi:hypothetical protein